MHTLNQYNLRIAPGYKTAMSLYGERIMLCAEVAHKLFNIDSVLQVIANISRETSSDNFKTAVCNQLIGQTVMTMYNKRTYKIDDIAWEEKPSDEFELKDGKKTSFKDYYYEHYKIQIKDSGQPLLISNPKAKDKRGGNDQPIRLVPELCSLTGTILLKSFDRDFRMKKELDAITKLNPQTRYQKLTHLLEKIKRTPEAKQDMDRWQIDFSPDVVKASATVLPHITVQFANTTTSNTERGWNNSLRNGFHLTSVPLRDWVIVFPGRDENKARMFSDELISVARQMNFNVEHPRLARLPDLRGSPGAMFAQMIKENLSNGKSQMVVCIVPNQAKDVYDAIKKVRFIS